MSLQVTSAIETQYNPVFLEILTDIKGGVTISTTRIPTTTKFLFPGTPLAASASSIGLYNVVKTAKLKKTIGAASCVTIYVYSSSLPNSPGQIFKANEYIMIDGRGTAVTIASITIGTKTNGIGTDIIYLTAGSGGLHCTAITGTEIQEATAGGLGTGATVKFSAACLLRNSVRVRLESGTTLQNITAGAVTRGDVDESIMPFVSPDEAVKTPLTARIRFA